MVKELSPLEPRRFKLYNGCLTYTETMGLKPCNESLTYTETMGFKPYNGCLTYTEIRGGGLSHTMSV